MAPWSTMKSPEGIINISGGVVSENKAVHGGGIHGGGASFFAVEVML